MKITPEQVAQLTSWCAHNTSVYVNIDGIVMNYRFLPHNAFRYDSVPYKLEHSGEFYLRELKNPDIFKLFKPKFKRIWDTLNNLA